MQQNQAPYIQTFVCKHTAGNNFSCCLFLLTMYIYIYTFCMLLYVYWHMLDFTCLIYLCSILLVAFLPRPQSNGDCIWGCSVHPPLPSGVGHCRCCSVVCEWVVHTHWGAYLLYTIAPNCLPQLSYVFVCCLLLPPYSQDLAAWISTLVNAAFL